MAIKPGPLVSQVKTAAPFLFDGPLPAADGPLAYIRTLREYSGGGLTGTQYYRLCLSAHWATAGSFVPTDVDNAIRWKLWQDASPAYVALCSDAVLEALAWDYGPVTARVVRGPAGLLSTHEGTWFSVAVGAYAACRAPEPARAQAVLAAMRAEAEREAAVLAGLAASGDGVAVLKASALVAHNFGDLDRVVDQWELGAGDPIRELYDLAKPGSKAFGGLLGWAGELNQAHMSADNHRHYPLRTARGLRAAPELLLPVGPFFDDWGRRVARHPALSREDVAEVVRALLDGWVRLHEPAGYARALAGILEVFPGGRSALSRLLPSKDRRQLESGTLKSLMDVSQERFESQWANKMKKNPPPGRPAAGSPKRLTA